MTKGPSWINAENAQKKYNEKLAKATKVHE